MQKFNFSYDKMNDDLFLYNPHSNSNGSVELGDFVFDYNDKKEIVGLQIMKASNIIKDLIEEKDKDIVKDVLNNLETSYVDIKIKNNSIIIKIQLFGNMHEISATLSIPGLKETSPALIYQ